MKSIMLFSIGCLIGFSSISQASFVVNRGNVAMAFRSLDSALVNAQSGDTIYLPGGTYNIGPVVIDKKLTMYGAGHYYDSTIATGKTVLNGSLFFITGSSLSVLQGVYLTGNIYLGSNATNSKVNGLVISRSNIGDLTFSFDANAPSLATSILVDENVIRGDLHVMDAKDNLFENNLLDGRILNANGSNRFMNNIIFGRPGTYNWTLNNVNSCIFENNIFYAQADRGFLSASTANTYRNNVFGLPNYLAPTDVSENNIFNATNLFVNQTLSAFSYEQNFHLKAGSAAIGAGKGGTDCGIYGGARPYKESAVPLNPHVQSKLIADNTDNNGKINVQIQVAAQQQ